MNYFKFLSSLAISFSAAAIGSLATTPNIPTWYASLEKPFFNPPNWLFGPVWSILYILIGLSLYMLWTVPSKKSKRTAYIIFAIQMTFNALWSLIFFGLHQTWIGLAVIILLDISVVVSIVKLRRYSTLAGLLFIPYLGWICFATILNASIAILN